MWEVMDMAWIRKRIIHWLVNTADSSELSQIVQAVVRRYGSIFEEEEVVFLSLPKHDTQERHRIIRAVLEIEQNWE